MDIMDIRRIIREELKKSSIFAVMNEGHTTNDKNYDFPPIEIYKKLDELKSTGAKLDSNFSENIAGLQVLSTGERSGRALAEIGYPDGTVVLFYSSMKGTGSKTQGDWYPIAGFASESAPALRVPKGWFIKTHGVDNRYGIKTFQGTADYLKANEDNLGKEDIEEIDMSVGGPGLKPGIQRHFPQEKKGGHSLNLSVSDGPHQFPKEEDL